MTNCSKRGQASGLEVSILIILIALFIGAYVILLPPEEREELLETMGEGAAAEGEEPTNILLSETPGTVEGYKKNVQKVSLEPMHLYVKEETETESLIKSITVSKSLLSDNYKDVLFSIDDLNELGSAKITAQVAESEGNLIIKLNGNEIYEGKLSANDIPLELPRPYLKKQNVLELSVSSPGWKIFSANKYVIKDLNLIKETSTRKTTAARAFSIDTTDNKVRKAELSYFVNCNKANEGELTIKLNGKQVFQDAIFCEYADERELTLNTADIKEGKNVLEFGVDIGDYNIDEAEVELTLEKSTFPSYAFELKSSDLDKQINLYLTFPTSDKKEATITMNDKQFEMSISQKEYKRDISSLVSTGTNTVTIMPAETFEITKLQIRAE